MLTLIESKVPFLLSEASRECVALCQKSADGTTPKLQRDVQITYAQDYKKGDLTNLTTPTLMGDVPIIVIKNAEKLTDDLIDDVKKLIADSTKRTSTPDIIIEHSGLVRGKAMKDAIKKASTTYSALYSYVDMGEVKNNRDKVNFTLQRAQKNGKQFSPSAAALLVEYEGEDIGILAGYINQLCNDAYDLDIIDDAYVNQFFKGIKQVVPWDISDAAYAKDIVKAIRLYRNSITLNGTTSTLLPLLEQLFSKYNQIIRVQALNSGRITMKEIGMAPWQLNTVKGIASRFNERNLPIVLKKIVTARKAIEGNSSDQGVYATQDVLKYIAGC